MTICLLLSLGIPAEALGFARAEVSASINIRPVTDWVMSRVPDDFVGDCEVWLGDRARKARQFHELGPVLLLTDCTHPLQNVWVDRYRVVAWRPLQWH